MIHMTDDLILIDGVEVGAKPPGVSHTRWGEIADQVNGMEETIKGLTERRAEVDGCLQDLMYRLENIIDG